MTPVLVFDIETIPDVAGLRRVHGAPDSVDDAGLLEWVAQQRRAQSGNLARQSFRDTCQKAQRCGYKVRGKTLRTEAPTSEKIDRSSRSAR